MTNNVIVKLIFNYSCCRRRFWWPVQQAHWPLTLKSMPTVEMKLPERNSPSRNRTSKHVLPTPESPSSITCIHSNAKELIRHNLNEAACSLLLDSLTR